MNAKRGAALSTQRAMRADTYSSVDRYATMSRASASLTPRIGITVPGFTAGGFSIHCIRISGVLGTTPVSRPSVEMTGRIWSGDDGLARS
jgi:hypothetical protein